jgi:hypothetical protein
MYKKHSLIEGKNRMPTQRNTSTYDKKSPSLSVHTHFRMTVGVSTA